MRDAALTAPPIESGRTLGVAFGMDVSATVPIAGLSPRDAALDHPRVSIELDTDPPPIVGLDDGAELLRRTDPAGTLYASIHHHVTRGYRIYFAGCGTYEIAADGSSIVCRPSAGLESWEWQQFLFGQALPFAAVLNGLEPLHASAVVIHGSVIAFAGGSGAGKSSIALQLASRGAGFFTDDVLVLTRSGPETSCHGGPSLANVRDGWLRTRAERLRRPFTGVVGGGEESTRTLVATERGPLPLGCLYFLERAERHERVRIQSEDDPGQLLGHTFNAVICTPERLVRQLDICAHLTASAAVFRVTAPDWLPAGELAALIEAHALNSRQRG